MFGRKKVWFQVFSCLLLIGFLNACAKKQVKKVTTDEELEKVEDELESEELDIHGKEFVPSKNLEKVYFDYDSPDLSEAVRKTLSSNADYLKKNKDFEILVEGHCDQRGTVGYNLALGQKRAAVIRKYYISLGIKPKRIGTVSFGKEKGECAENSEECWAKNRRAETKVRAPSIVENHKDKKEPGPVKTEPKTP